MSLCLLAFTPTFVAQNLIDDFETGNKGWANVEASSAIVDNPVKSALNQSEKVLSVTRAKSTSAFWAGAILNPTVYPEGIYLHVKMYRNNTNQPKLKVSDSPAFEIGPMGSITIEEYKWQDVVFDISGATSKNFVFIMLDQTFATLENDVVVYIDDIMVSNDPAPRTAVEVPDNVKPVMGTAVLVNAGYSKATITFTATDLDGDNASTVVSNFVVNDVANGIVDKVVKTDAQGNGVLGSLTASTSYNLTIKAKDNSGNLSDNSALLSFTTTAVPNSIVIDDFENGNQGWRSENGANAVEVVGNPQISGMNNSANVMQSGRVVGSNNWAAVMLPNLSIDGGMFKYMHVMMYRNTIATVPNVKVSDTAGGDIAPLASLTMEANVWQDVVFDISAIDASKKIDFIYFMFDRGVLTEDLVALIDNIEISNDPNPRTGTSTKVVNPKYAEYKVVGGFGVLTVGNLNGESVSVYNSEGQLISSQCPETNTLSVSLRKGLYLVRIGSTVLKTVVK